IGELTQANDDMKNMLNRTEIATIFLDCDLKIRRYTPEATKLFNLIQSDIDRPISHIVSNLKYEHVLADVKKVLDTLVFKETQIETKDGEWYLMRITPYRTHRDSIDGVVINFTDITALKELTKNLKEREAFARKARMFVEGIIETVREPLIMLDTDFRVVFASPSFYQAFAVTPEQTEKKLLFELGSRQWDIPRLKKLIADLGRSNKPVNDFVVEQDFPSLGRRKMLLNIRALAQSEKQEGSILISIEDITGR
ncbi:MAG TPA: PAS domain-containing protein, partial [Dissulfurispiraceae bacterium]|nr:PAS domain-containing protein [Dissulfurispiraceae bacterium]